MHILVCGANGFVGRELCKQLTQGGHHVRKGVRHANAADEIAIDYARDLDANTWAPRLIGIDVVINAIGILVEHGTQRFETIHTRAPIALFDACEINGVKRVIQLSALGAQSASTAYFASKLAADNYLMQTQLEWQVVRPALIYGTTGNSATVFRMLASIPVLFLPAAGKQRVQPIHVEDLATVICKLIEPTAITKQCVDVAGAQELSYREMLLSLRRAMGFTHPLIINIPAVLISAAAKLLDHIPGAMLTSDNWRMLQNGNIAAANDTARLLERRPRRYDDFISATEAPYLRAQALSAWRIPLLRASLAIVWLVSGIVSAVIYPHAARLQLLAGIGLHGNIASLVLYGAAALDIAFGIVSISKPSRALWWLQFVVVATYSIVVAITLPEFLIHPFAPIIKNIPILAILMLLIAEDE